MSSTKSILASLVVFLVCLAFAAGGAYLFWSQQQAINNSVQATGTIESATVTEEVSERDTDDDGMLEEDTSYYADVTYNYTYQGEQYQSSNVFPGAGDPSVGAQRASEIVDDNPPGSEAEIYVNPDNPSEAYLIQEQNLVLPIGFMAFGGLLSLLSGYTFVSRLLGGGDEA